MKHKVIIKKIKEAYIPWEEGSFPGLLGQHCSGKDSQQARFGRYKLCYRCRLREFFGRFENGS